MSVKRPLLKKSKDSSEKLELPEVALAAVTSYKKQKEVTEFIQFMLGALQRNSNWLNSVIERQSDFKCVLMAGAGPNRFQIQETIYPTKDDTKLEVEIKDSEEHDQIAIAALLRLTNLEIDLLSKYIRTRMIDNKILRDDLLTGKSLGVSFVILRPSPEMQYRVTERIVIGSSTTLKKRRTNEKLLSAPPIKRTRRVA